MTDRELMQQALDALINAKGYIFHNVLNDKANQYDTAIEALRARLAQPEPEPVAWIYKGNLHPFDPSDWAEEPVRPLYTTPSQLEWQWLTDEEIGSVIEASQITLKNYCSEDWGIFRDFMPELERFANLVAAAEREACAQIAHDTYEGFGPHAKGVDYVKQSIMIRIRERGAP